MYYDTLLHPLFLALVVIRRDLQRLIASVADRSLCQMLNTLVASPPRSLLPLHSRVTKWFVVTRSIEGLTQTVHWQTSVSRNLISGLVIFGCGFEGSFSSSEAEKGPRLIWQRPSLTPPPPHSRLSPIVPLWHAPRPFRSSV